MGGAPKKNLRRAPDILGTGLKQSHANVSVYQADRCVTEQGGAEYHPGTVVIGLQSN